LTAAEARARIAAQARDEERRDIADALIVNDRSVDELQVEVDRLWQERIEPYAANLRDARPARDPETVVVPYDPTWPRQYERLAARVRHAVGDRRVDHVGSTAVPGLAAKNVIDLQLTVDSLDEADQLRGQLEAAAFVAVPAVDRDRPKPSDPNPEHWRKRFHGSADPGRPAHLHLRVAGSPGWRFALLFRDWLRANPDESAAYAAEKYRLAARYPHRDDYTQAKEPAFDAAIPRAERWAEQTGWLAPV
jgi:dephospho-CoA kinase